MPFSMMWSHAFIHLMSLPTLLYSRQWPWWMEVLTMPAALLRVPGTQQENPTNTDSVSECWACTGKTEVLLNFFISSDLITLALLGRTKACVTWLSPPETSKRVQLKEQAFLKTSTMKMKRQKKSRTDIDKEKKKKERNWCKNFGQKTLSWQKCLGWKTLALL